MELSLMSNSELFQALQMFQQGVQQAAATSAVNEAHKAMNQINASVTDEAQKRTQLQDLGNQLALRLTGAGASAAAVQNAFQAVAPKQFNSVDQMEMEGELTGSALLKNTAGGMKSRAMKSQKELMELQHKHKLAEIDATYFNKSLLEDGKLRPGKELSTAELSVFQDADNTLQALNQVSQLYDDLDSKTIFARTGPFSTQTWDRHVSGTRTKFNMQVDQFFNTYRKLISGAAVSAQEMEQLELSIPSKNDTPIEFTQKIEKSIENTRMLRERTLKQLKAAGRDVTGLEKMVEEERQVELRYQEKASDLKRASITGK